jgi:hypothetical protein
MARPVGDPSPVKLEEIVPFGPKAVTMPAPNNEATNVVPVTAL